MTETEKRMLHQIVDMLMQATGYYDRQNKQHYVDASGFCLSAYEDALNLLEEYDLLDAPRTRETNTGRRKMQRIRTEKLP